MKRKLSFIALSLAVVISLAACGGGSNTGNSSGSTAGGASTDNAVVADTSVTGFDFAKYKVDYTPASDVSKAPKVSLDRKDTMVAGLPDTTGIFNSMMGDNAYDIYACTTMFDTNIEADFDGKVIPGATDYKISDDGLTYTFKLKDGIKYWDGNPATAKDLECAYYLMADPKYEGPSDISKAFIKGLNDYKAGSATAISGIKVIDDKTLEINTEKPSGATLLNLQVPLMEKAYYCPEMKKGEVYAKFKEKNGAPMGTGQYKFISYKPGQEIKLVANENYFKRYAKNQKSHFLYNTSRSGIAKASCR